MKDGSGAALREGMELFVRLKFAPHFSAGVFETVEEAERALSDLGVGTWRCLYGKGRKQRAIPPDPVLKHLENAISAPIADIRGLLLALKATSSSEDQAERRKRLEHYRARAELKLPLFEVHYEDSSAASATASGTRCEEAAAGA